MDLKRHKLAAIGAAGGVITLGAAVLGGTALAQTGGSGSTPSPTPSAAQQQRQAQRQAEMDTVLNDLAKNLGVDRGKLDAALKTTAKDQVAAAVSSGKLTQAQATQIDQSIDSGTAPFGFGLGFGADFGGRGHGGPQIPAGVGQAAQDAVSKALGGETAAQIRQELQAGKTFDQIAQAHNTTVQAVRDAVTAAVKPLLDQAVSAGTITAAQEQQILDGIKNGRGFGFGGDHGPGPRGMNGGQGTSSTSTSTQ